MRAKRAVLLLFLILLCLVVILILLPEREAVEPPTAERAPAERAPAAEERQERAVRRSRIAVVIDDVGYNLENLEPFLSFPEALSLSVLPNLAHSRESAQRIREAGKELLLHLPMEPLNGEDPGPGAILTTQSEEEIRQALEQSFSQVPGASGTNNHMGSKATADERVMSVVMEYLRVEGGYFLDSRTTPDSVAGVTAKRYSVPFIQRSVFLDNDPAYDAIREALEKGIELSMAGGYAVLIGHIQNPQIVEALMELLSRMERAGVELTTVSALLDQGDGQP